MAERENLSEALADLEREATRYPGRRESLLSDFVLYSFVTDVREHARAVEILTSSQVPRTALTTGRAALESALDAAFLVADPSQYLYRGAQARVAELYEVHELHRRAQPIDTAASIKEPNEAMHPEDIIVADASSWDEDAPGRGAILRKAWEAYTKDPGALRKHWSLLSKEDVYQTVFAGDEAKVLSGMADVVHGLLSMASHPRTRAGAREITFTDDGGVVLGTKKTDAEAAREIAAFACILVTAALQRRRSFSYDAA
jgi:hypothetical protein